MLTNPRTVCGCHPVAFMISGRVAPFARCIIPITSAFLLARSAFFAGLAFLADLLLRLAGAAAGSGMPPFPGLASLSPRFHRQVASPDWQSPYWRSC
jgi:hypothetical protein